MDPRPRVPFGFRRSSIALALGLAFVVSACGGSEASAGPTGLRAAERDYIDGVLVALDQFQAQNRKFGEVLGQVYLTNEALFGALAAVGAGTAFEPGLEALEGLHPPAGFEDDHAILLDRQRSLILLDRDVGIAVAEADLERFVVLNMRLALVSNREALRLEPAICEPVMRHLFTGSNTTQSPSYLAAVFCDRSEVSGGEYGTRVRDILATMTTEVNSRGEALAFFGLVPVVPDEALLEVANEAFTEMFDVTKTAIGEIRRLEPPEEMAADHRHLLEYLSELERIMDDGVRDALARDPKAFGLADFADLYCQTRQEIDPSYRAIVRVHFADLFGICPPGSDQF
jgi:hypothetical protein